MKILGYILTNKLSHDKYINSLISKVNHRIYSISLIAKYMTVKHRIMITTSIVMSVIRYSLLLLTDVNYKQLNILNILINKVARRTLGYHSYRWSNTKILKKCKWLNATHLIIYSILTLFHKVNINIIPKSISNLFIYNHRPNQ